MPLSSYEEFKIRQVMEESVEFKIVKKRIDELTKISLEQRKTIRNLTIAIILLGISTMLPSLLKILIAMK